MPKTVIAETRNDFTGGLNVVANPDAMNSNELLQCLNVRVEQFGGLMRRPGSKKLNATPFGDGDPLSGIVQWGGSNQVVAISDDGNLYYSTAPYAVWTTLNPGTSQLLGIPNWQQFRAAVGGAPLRLYIAINNSLQMWTGSALSTITTGGLAPSRIKAYGSRLFLNDLAHTKNLFWSAIGDPADWSSGGVSGTGSALVDILTGDQIVALETLSDSLLIGTNESICRFTGTGDDIQIAQDTLGVSTEIGPSGSTTWSYGGMIRMEQIAVLHADRGIYIATTGGVVSIGDAVVAPTQQALRMSTAIDSQLRVVTPIVGHNRRRNEAWVAYVPVGGTRRDRCLIYSYRLQCWYGPFIYPFGITCLNVFEDALGVESIMAGCDDGYIRLLDDPTAPLLDDGSTDYESTVEFVPFGRAGNGPRTTKISEHVFLQAIGERTFDVTVAGRLGVTDNGVFVE